MTIAFAFGTYKSLQTCICAPPASGRNPMRRLEGHTHDVMAVAFAPDGGRVGAAGWGGTVRVWDLASGRCERVIRTAHEHAFDVAFSPDGRFLAAGFRHDGAPELFTSGYGTGGWFPGASDPKKSPGLS